MADKFPKTRLELINLARRAGVTPEAAFNLIGVWEAFGVRLVPANPTEAMVEAVGLDDDLDLEGAITDAIAASPYAPEQPYV